MPIAAVLLRAIVEGGLFDMWGASEWFAFIGLTVTIGGVYLAVTSLEETRRQAQATARDTRLILENELAAKLEFAPGHDGRLIGGIVHPPADGPQFMHAYLRNVGRYPARDIRMEITYGDERVKAENTPATLPADASSQQFQFLLNIPADQHVFSMPLRFHVTHRDGNATTSPLDTCYRLSYDQQHNLWDSFDC